MNAVHRQTAADWHRGEESSALYAYATTGAIRAGIAGEIDVRLVMIERAEVGGDLDRVGEHQRLRALLHHVQPQFVAASAYDVGQDHGRSAAQRWRHDALDDRPVSETVATARRILEAFDEGDPEIFDLASGWDEVASPAEIADQSGWPEPGIDDVETHRRWEAAQFDICGAYVAGFVDAFWDVAVVACRGELVDASPHIRPAGSSTIVDPAGGEVAVPPGWVAESIGLWVGVRSEVIYNPRRLEVDVTDVETVGASASVGWQIVEPGGSRVLRIRDRGVAARAALDRLDHRIAEAQASGPPQAEAPPTFGAEL